jgi:uncharacterized protein YdaU (DUF1376 family)
MEWYKRDPVDFINGVQGMSPELIGAYAVLIDLFYSRGGEARRDDRHLAGILGCSIRSARSLTDRLIEIGKIEAEGDFITNSRAKREAKRARNTGEARVKSQRNRREREAAARENNDLSDKSMSLEAIPEKRREEKIQEGTDVPSWPRKRGARLPENWVLPLEWGQWAITEGWAETVIRSEADKFRDYWIGRSGKDATKADWQATWRNWMRNSKAPKIVDGGGYERTAKSAERLRAFIGGAE